MDPNLAHSMRTYTAHNVRNSALLFALLMNPAKLIYNIDAMSQLGVCEIMASTCRSIDPPLVN